MPQRTIDGFEFAAVGGVQRGECPVADLPRLHDMLRDSAGVVCYEVRGNSDSLGRAALQVKVAAELQLTCTRCLEALAYRLEVESTLVLARSEAEIEAGALDLDAPERILAGTEMPVRDLIEDEVLLAVPVAPRHEHCAPQPGVAGGRKPSPFAGLRRLLDKSNLN